MPKGLKDVKWQCFYTVTRSCDSISYVVGPDNYLLVVIWWLSWDNAFCTLVLVVAYVDTVISYASPNARRPTTYVRRTTYEQIGEQADSRQADSSSSS